MIAPTPDSGRLRPRRSAAWSLAWRAGYRLARLLDPLIRSWVANDLPGLDGVVELRFVGRRTGRRRRVRHPNGETAWLRNIAASGWLEVDPAAAHGRRFRVERLPPGAERDAVIEATARQQPFPANLLYRAARRHVAAVGVYVRLVPEAAAED